jgi:hypothetical protein
MLGAVATPLARSALAQTGNITRIVVPFPPGGTADPIARMVQPGLQQRLERRVTERKAPPLHLPLFGRRFRFLCSFQKSFQSFCHVVTFPNRIDSLQLAAYVMVSPTIYYVYSPKSPQNDTGSGRVAPNCG